MLYRCFRFRLQTKSKGLDPGFLEVGRGDAFLDQPRLCIAFPQKMGPFRLFSPKVEALCVLVTVHLSKSHIQRLDFSKFRLFYILENNDTMAFCGCSDKTRHMKQ
jgi:hypothetical protein